jgi:hypothetical protein
MNIVGRVQDPFRREAGPQGNMDLIKRAAIDVTTHLPDKREDVDIRQSLCRIKKARINFSEHLLKQMKLTSDLFTVININRCTVLLSGSYQRIIA